jgi:X-Pro dipeptidyl-peptidase
MHRCLWALATLLLLPAGARAAVMTETLSVPTVDGASISVDVAYDDQFGKVPVLLTYSPYNTLGENGGNLAEGDPWIKKGYARAIADVLGTRASTGCWDYGGPKEIQSGVDVVKALAAQPWSNGNVGMIGGSYDGTTATMVAAQGDAVPELKAIVPIAAISRWYGYAYGDGVRYFLNSEAPTDEGFDTPLLFDAGFALTAPLPTHDAFADAAAARATPCPDAVEHTQRGYSTSPDYDDFWLERDYRKDAGRIRAAVLIAHGWQDYNVKQEEGIALWDAIPEANVPLKRMFLTQGTHSTPSGALWNDLLDGFLGRYLKGEDTGVENSPAVITTGRTVDDSGAYEDLEPREETAWPPAGTTDRTLFIRRSFDQDLPVELPPPGTGETGTLSPEPTDAEDVFTWVDTGVMSEEVTTRDPLNEDGHGYYSLFHKSEPLSAPLRMVGRAVLDATVIGSGGTTLTPVLVDVAPDGTLTTVARGFLNLDYRNGLAKAEPTSDWAHARVSFLPQDFTFPAGHAIGLLLQGSNTVWALPGTPGPVNIDMGGADASKLILPIAP